jgi:hypothetical protein
MNVYIIHSSVKSTMEDACSPNTLANAAIVASIAASNPKMVEALGGAQMFEAAAAAIGFLDVFPTGADEQVPFFDDDDVDPTSPPIKRQRRVFARVRKEASTWWIKFLAPEMRLDMETEIDGRVFIQRRRLECREVTSESGVALSSPSERTLKAPLVC